MTANHVRYSLKDWAIGITAFMLFGVVVLPIAFVILRATAPYGWNHIAMPASVAGLMMLAWAIRRRDSRS
jgi:hypothetical protein